MLACFEWPDAPTQEGRLHSLRTTPDGCYGRYTAQLIDPAIDMGYVAISNPQARLLLLYVFRRSDFPWIGNWEEVRDRAWECGCARRWRISTSTS
jgi:hypothetical protein